MVKVRCQQNLITSKVHSYLISDKSCFSFCMSRAPATKAWYVFWAQETSGGNDSILVIFVEPKSSTWIKQIVLLVWLSDNLEPARALHSVCTNWTWAVGCIYMCRLPVSRVYLKMWSVRCPWFCSIAASTNSVFHHLLVVVLCRMLPIGLQVVVLKKWKKLKLSKV